MVGIAKENLTPGKFSEYSFGNAKFSPSWIIRVLKEGKFEGKLKVNCVSESVYFAVQ